MSLKKVLVRLAVRFHGTALPVDQGHHRQHLPSRWQESVAVQCRCSRPQFHRSGLARHMGWVDCGVLGTTDRFALGHASSLFGGAVVECPYHFGGWRGWHDPGRGLG